MDSANKTLPIFKTADKTSIVGAPFAQIVGGKTYVVFITGRYFNKSDLPSTTKPVQNYAYGIIESKIGDNRTPTGSGALIADGVNLLQHLMTSKLFQTACHKLCSIRLRITKLPTSIKVGS